MRVLIGAGACLPFVNAIAAPEDAAAIRERAVQSYQLDTRTLSDGGVKAIVEGRVERVTLENVDDRANEGAVFYSKTRFDPDAPIPGGLRTAVIDPGLDKAVQLGYIFSAQEVANRSFVRLKALLAPGNGLLFDGQKQAFFGSFVIALINAIDPDDRSDLITPVTIFVQAPGAIAVAPHPVRISSLGRWEEVSITVPTVMGARYRVAVSADPQDDGDTLEIAVLGPTVRLSASRTHITGWGIGRTKIAVAATGIEKPLGYVVNLSSDFGGLSDSFVKLDDRGRGETELRSDSASRTTIAVTNLGVDSEPISVTFSAPWLYLVAAFLGGILGAFLRGRGRAHWVGALAVGAGSGVLMALAVAVGINWVPAVFPTATIAHVGEAVVFVLAAVGALLGVQKLVPAGEQS